MVLDKQSTIYKSLHLFGFLILGGLTLSSGKSESSPSSQELKCIFHFQEPQLSSYKQELEKLAQKTFRAHSAFFEGPPRYPQNQDSYRIEFHISGTPGGDADPGKIKIGVFEGKIFGFYTWQIGLVHEMFHLWSAESFRYSSQKEQWFNEGVTEYFTLLASRRLGLIDADDLLNILSIMVANYSTAPALEQISMRDAASSFEQKIKNYFLIYQGGCLAAFCLDLDIRRRSKGAKSLQDLMRYLYQNHDAESKPYDQKAILLGLQETTGLDYSDFLKKYIEGTAPLPLRDSIDFGKLRWHLKKKTFFGLKEPDHSYRYIEQILNIK